MPVVTSTKLQILSTNASVPGYSVGLCLMPLTKPFLLQLPRSVPEWSHDREPKADPVSDGSAKCQIQQEIPYPELWIQGGPLTTQQSLKGKMASKYMRNMCELILLNINYLNLTGKGRLLVWNCFHRYAGPDEAELPILSPRDELRKSLIALPDLDGVTGLATRMSKFVCNILNDVSADVPAPGTENAFHYSYDALITEPVRFFYGEIVVYLRNKNSERLLRPDAVYAFGNGYVLFKGEETGEEDTPGDPADELVDNHGWPYEHILVTFCVLYQEDGATHRLDLQTFDIRTAEGRLPEGRTACLQAGTNLSTFEFECAWSMTRPSGKTLEFYLDKMVKTCPNDIKATSACRMYALTIR
ncbi:hypothetical protein SELMODRAFT_420907 [Selaginella moellendorffii]|uniref:Uncharacterized protein n=1 Tax=Selaginella moellendorffii TaxID=88036 RepID=D8SDH9_SELML|nr:hypothetical protein SELMODRAFT_420907 [Selaginella moellendorffii]